MCLIIRQLYYCVFFIIVSQLYKKENMHEDTASESSLTPLSMQWKSFQRCMLRDNHLTDSDTNKQHRKTTRYDLINPIK